MAESHINTSENSNNGETEDSFKKSLKQMLSDSHVDGNSNLNTDNDMRNISLSSPATSMESSSRGYRIPQSTSLPTVTPSQSKLDEIKEWSFSTYKFTKQLVSEKLGRASKTVDAELEAQIAELRDTQHKYMKVLTLAKGLATHFQRALQTQQSLGDAFGEMAQRNPELREEFSYNSETMKVLSRNGDNLMRALNTFTSTLNTLCNKTITDTLLTVKQYEAARVEFDAYRQDVEYLESLSSKDQSVNQKLPDAQQRFQVYKEKYDRLRDDVSIKMKFLDENRIKVMHNQLQLFHHAVGAYFSGNQIGLEDALKQFDIRMKNPASEKLSSFLANHN